MNSFCDTGDVDPAQVSERDLYWGILSTPVRCYGQVDRDLPSGSEFSDIDAHLFTNSYRRSCCFKLLGMIFVVVPQMGQEGMGTLSWEREVAAVMTSRWILFLTDDSLVYQYFVILALGFVSSAY